MKSNVIKIDFNNAVALNMDDQVSLRDIHAKLVEKGGTAKPFTDWVKGKLKHYVEDADYTSESQKSETGKGASGISTTKEFYTTVQVAMEILANGHGQVGHEMRRFMSECVRKVVENRIELPFDINDRLSILQYATEAIREVTEKLNTETQLRLVAEKRWENVQEVGDRIGTAQFLKEEHPEISKTMFRPFAMLLTRVCKKLCTEAGLDLITLPSDYGNYNVFPRSVLQEGYKVLKDRHAASIKREQE